jgi:TorA maturation chaperone TorD
MPLNREDYENLLSELLNPELDAARKTDIVTSLRDDKTEATTEYESLTVNAQKLKQDNEALVIANSKLFRQTGVLQDKKEPQEEKKEFSQTIKLSDIEKNI